MDKWQVGVHRRPERTGVDIFVYRKNGVTRTEVLKSDGSIVDMPRGAAIEPTLSLEEDIFRELVDAIHADFKPSEGKFTEGKVEATERHLQDLRHLLKIK